MKALIQDLTFNKIETLKQQLLIGGKYMLYQLVRLITLLTILVYHAYNTILWVFVGTFKNFSIFLLIFTLISLT